MPEKTLSGWGLYPKIKSLCLPLSEEKVYFSTLGDQAICFGNGRSYGDSALSNTTIHTRQHNAILNFDSEQGILQAESGILLSEILAVTLPKGWFLGVTPGTQWITLGGAIASDVHGKNHHIQGCFSQDVLQFNLIDHTGNIRTVKKNEEWFYATCGGMGLTGIILNATIQLKKISSSVIRQTTVKTKNLQETFDVFETYKTLPYSVAWIDCLAKKKEIGKAIFMGGDFAENGPLTYTSPSFLTVPFMFPNWVLNTQTVSVFNTLYYAKHLNKISQSNVPFHQFFYPLDKINQWNNIYGKNGFTQYQFILPKKHSDAGLTDILNTISNSGKGSFLAVLKLYGPENNNYLSFPLEGYSLALDFKIEPELFPLLEQLDQQVLKYQGRIYLSKDVRVSKSTFEQGYPHITMFRNFRKKYRLDQIFHSYQSRRLEL